MGVRDAGWLFVAVAVISGVLMIVVLPAAPAAALVPVETEPRPTFSPDRFLGDDHPDWRGHWAIPPVDWETLGIDIGNVEVLDEVRAAMTELPTELREVMVLRDVEGRTPDQVAQALGLTPAEERRRLHQARGRVRAHLEQYIEGRNHR